MNHYYTYGRQFDYLDYDRDLKKMGKQRYVKKIFQEAENDCALFLTKIKSLGLEINEHALEKKENPYLENYNELLKKQLHSEDKDEIRKHLSQVHQLNQLFVESNTTINKIFEEKTFQNKNLLSQFIVYLEYQLRSLRDFKNLDISFEKAITAFDTFISSSGVILTYLLYKINNDV